MMDILRFLLWVIATILVVALVIAVLWVRDVWDDRKHNVQVNSETPVFAGGGGGECDVKLLTRLTVAQPGATLRVRRIRYWKNCATVDIALPDGQEGYIVLGQGEVSITPPLD
jgi:hypothetical protein